MAESMPVKRQRRLRKPKAWLLCQTLLRTSSAPSRASFVMLLHSSPAVHEQVSYLGLCRPVLGVLIEACFSRKKSSLFLEVGDGASRNRRNCRGVLAGRLIRPGKIDAMSK
jgi:hypothetical protein